MKHIKISLLLFLVTTLTQCMEMEKIKKIDTDRRDIIRAEALFKDQYKFAQNRTVASQLLFRSNWPMTCSCCFNPAVYSEDKTYRVKGYSCFGLIAIALNNNHQPDIFSQKKDYIFKLRQSGCKPTVKDKNFALWEKWKRCTQSMKKEICLVYHINHISAIPKEIKSHIATLMFFLRLKTTESLF